MSENLSKNHPEYALLKIVEDLKNDVEKLKNNQLKRIQIPQVTADPASPVEGEIWENTTSHVFKIFLNGVVKTVTVT